ncbi:substrate-binding domain-containing protein [Diaphorobacter sp. HDW4A]|uniref:substrate-binding domain-containing protein n=1 Tax=Diaphorobacter sp. HDW4A TaxID=2714924 RepID=UPI00197DF1E9|nr:substrate-binding domain-containing protein [Diaphorobacter sp. HDW4A]
MTSSLKGISSMATRPLLARLVAEWEREHGVSVQLESVGGVDAERRVAAGEESFDVVFLASNALERLIASGHAVAASRIDLAISDMAAAVREGDAVPDISNEAALRDAVLAASSVGYSTGPSGTALLELLAHWGVADALRARLVQAPAGVPVGRLVAEGRVALGFQQRSELVPVDGITVLSPLPGAARITTLFSGARVTGASHPLAAMQLLEFLRSPRAVPAKLALGMQPV